MSDNRPAGPVPARNPWPLVLCLVGLDYFSTLAYLPSMAVEAAGTWAPLAVAGVVLVTFLVALPIYWYIVGRAPDGRGAAGMLEDLIPGWRGKLVVLTLLGFAAADFVITRSLSLADAAIHLLSNPHGQRLLARIPDELFLNEHWLWPPAEALLRRLTEPAVFVTLALSVVSFVALQILRRGVGRRMLQVAAFTVTCYLAFVTLVIVSAALMLYDRPPLEYQAADAIFVGTSATQNSVGGAFWAWLKIFLWTFPQLALGLSGFELMLTVVPLVSGSSAGHAGASVDRARDARKLMVTAATIMAVYLLSAVWVTSVLVPPSALGAGGAAEHRALSYLAHSVLFSGSGFGDLFDLSTVLILCLAGASASIGLRSMLPHYLNRLGMDVSWAGRFGAILLVLNAVVLLVTVVFQASPRAQQWAYATSVLVLLAGAAFAAACDLQYRANYQGKRSWHAALCAIAFGFFLFMTGLTVLINHSGLTIALAFVLAILATSIISRWIRSTELRFEGFEFANTATHDRWQQLCQSGPKVLVPHRPGLISLTQKQQDVRRDYRHDPRIPVIFIEATLGDPSNFYQSPFMKIEHEEGLEVIRVSRCVSVSHVLAAICLELCRGTGEPPEMIFGWSSEPPLAANLNFLLLGEGNIPWMVKELLRKSIPASARQPRILIG